jgi:flagellar basal-body rod modification protein FlgD
MVNAVFSESNMEALNSLKTTSSNNDMSKDMFLKILTTQLSHQDPLSPLEDKDFIAQMAQFSSLEQLNSISQTLENTSTDTNNSFSMLALISEQIGKLVESQTELNEKVNELINVNKANSAYL